MSVFLWIIVVVLALIFGVFSTVIWGTMQNKKTDKNGYKEGYADGVEYENHRLYKVRLLRQTQRAAAKENKHESPTDPRSRSREVSVGLEPSGGIASSSTGNLFVDPVDPGADSEPGRLE